MFKLNRQGCSANKVGTGEWHDVKTSEEYLEWLAEGNTTEPADLPTPEELAVIAQAAQDKADAQELKADTKFQNLISKTPAQCKNWCENNFPSLTLSEQKDLATLVMAIGILGRRL
jgi:hypothetical protein